MMQIIILINLSMPIRSIKYVGKNRWDFRTFRTGVIMYVSVTNIESTKPDGFFSLYLRLCLSDVFYGYRNVFSIIIYYHRFEIVIFFFLSYFVYVF